MSRTDFSHLNLRSWPFNVVPSPDTATVWVGRAEADREFKRVLRNLERVGNSQIVFIWASFGSGKTHALRYLENQARLSDGVAPLYVVVPQGVRSFFDIYHAIVSAAVTSGLVTQLGHHVFAHGSGHSDGDLEQALRQHLAGGHAATVADAWLRGEKVYVKDLRAIGLAQRLETVPDAIQTLSDLVHLSVESGRRVLLLLDEVQELEDLGKKLPECVGGLHKVFDQNATGLAMLLSFTTGAQSSVRAIMGDALWSRASDTLVLPAFDRAEAEAFVIDLIKEWSIDPSRAPFPFAPAAVSAVVNQIGNAAADLTPRDLVHAFSKVLSDAEFDIGEGDLSIIDESYAIEALAGRVTIQDDDV